MDQLLDPPRSDRKEELGGKRPKSAVQFMVTGAHHEGSE